MEQSANDMNEIKAQLKNVDAGHQTLVQKVSGMENGVADRLDDLAKADASLLAKLSALEFQRPDSACGHSGSGEEDPRC